MRSATFTMAAGTGPDATEPGRRRGALSRRWSAGWAVLACLAAAPAAAQVTFSRDAIEEIQSISVRVDVLGNADDGQLPRLLAEVVRQELIRSDILFERGDPRPDECCLLRLDVRLAQGAGRSRFGVGYTARLELGYQDRLGAMPTWTVLWSGRLLGNIVERAELEVQLRSAARELAGDFVDLYRERFPRR